MKYRNKQEMIIYSFLSFKQDMFKNDMSIWYWSLCTVITIKRGLAKEGILFKFFLICGTFLRKCWFGRISHANFVGSQNNGDLKVVNKRNYADFRLYMEQTSLQNNLHKKLTLSYGAIDKGVHNFSLQYRHFSSE